MGQKCGGQADELSAGGSPFCGSQSRQRAAILTQGPSFPVLAELDELEISDIDLNPGK